MAKNARALNEDAQDQEVNAVLEKRIAAKYRSLVVIHGQTLEEVFTSLPEEMHLKFKAAIETNADKEIEDIIIDFIIEEKIPFKKAKDVALARGLQDGAAAGVAAAPNQPSLEIRRYIEDSLRNYARIRESRRMLEPEGEVILPEFKDKKAALEALKVAQTELEASKKIFAKTLADEEKISKLLKKKASAGEAQELSRIYREGIISQMHEAHQDLKSKAQLVLEIIDSEHIQNDITLKALAAENKTSMSWLRGTMDSPAALKKATTSAKEDADKALVDYASFSTRFKDVKAEVGETAETTKYSEILPILINQIPLEQHKSIEVDKYVTIKSSVFEAIQYLAKNGAIEAMDPMAPHKDKDARINNSAKRISKKLAEFTPEARERILVKTADAMVIGQNF